MTKTDASFSSSSKIDSIEQLDSNSDGIARNGMAENGTAEGLGRDNVFAELMLSPADGSTEEDIYPAEVSLLESALAQSSEISSRLSQGSAEGSYAGLSTALPKSSGKRAFEIANRMAKASTLENLYQITVTELRKRFQCDRAFIYRFQSVSAGSVIAESVKAGYTPTLGELLSAIAFGASRPQDYQTQSAVVMADASEEAVSPHQVQLLQRFQVQASLSLPIFVKEKLWGLLVTQQCDAARSWKEAEVGLLYQVSTELTLKLQSYELQQQSQKEIDRGETLSNVIRNIRGFSDIQKIFESTTKDLRNFLRADRVAVFQFMPGSNHTNGEVVVESVNPEFVAAKEVSVEDHCFGGQMAEEYRTGRIWAADDIYSLGLADCYINILAQFQVRANLVVPLLKDNQLWGLFCIHQCSRPRHWQTVEIAFVQRVAAQLDLAMQQAEYLDQLKEKTDKLTEVADREKASKEQLQQQVVELLRIVAPALKGDLTVRAPVTDTEVGTVASSYNTTLQSLQKIVLQVQQAANQVGETFTLSETSAVAVSQKAQQQAESLEQALARVQKMVSSTEAVAQDAQQVEAAAQQANQIVQRGDSAMNRTVDGIMAIRSTVAETNQRIKRLSESSQKVSKIVSLISHFTTQTQLLALNASIEATRAGQYGRGFAVVADEVRSLARQSAEAATEIEQFVQEIQMGTAEVSTAMETGIQQVAEGTHMVTDARQNLTAIVEATGQISQLIAEITRTTHKQADEFKVVTHTMTEATEIARQTSENSDELAHSIQQVLNTAEALQTSAGKFKVQ